MIFCIRPYQKAVYLIVDGIFLLDLLFGKGIVKGPHGNLGDGK